MDPKVEKKLRRLTINQAKALKSVITGKVNGEIVTGSYISNATGLTANALGGTVSALQRNEYIQPIGKIDRQFRWELDDPEIKKASDVDPYSLIGILSKVVGDEKK